MRKYISFYWLIIATIALTTSIQAQKLNDSANNKFVKNEVITAFYCDKLLIRDVLPIAKNFTSEKLVRTDCPLLTAYNILNLVKAYSWNLDGNYVILITEPGQSVDALIDSLKKNPFVRVAEPNYYLHLNRN